MHRQSVDKEIRPLTFTHTIYPPSDWPTVRCGKKKLFFLFFALLHSYAAAAKGKKWESRRPSRRRNSRKSRALTYMCHYFSAARRPSSVCRMCRSSQLRCPRSLALLMVTRSLAQTRLRWRWVLRTPMTYHSRSPWLCMWARLPYAHDTDRSELT